MHIPEWGTTNLIELIWLFVCLGCVPLTLWALVLSTRSRSALHKPKNLAAILATGLDSDQLDLAARIDVYWKRGALLLQSAYLYSAIRSSLIPTAGGRLSLDGALVFGFYMLVQLVFLGLVITDLWVTKRIKDNHFEQEGANERSAAAEPETQIEVH